MNKCEKIFEFFFTFLKTEGIYKISPHPYNTMSNQMPGGKGNGA